MTDATITINPDGTGSVLLEGATTAVQGSTAADARRQAIHHVTQRAASLGRALSATAHESGRVYPVLVNMDGTVTQLTRADGVDPSHSIDPAAASTQEPELAPIRPPVPDAENTTDVDDPRPRQILTDEWREIHPSAPVRDAVVTQSVDDLDQTVQPTSQLSTAPQLDPASRSAALDEAANVPPIKELEEMIEAEDVFTLDLADTDPRWIELAKQPAEQGVRGTLNGWGLKLAPVEDELEHRRDALRQQIASEEQERRAEEDRAATWTAQEGRRAAREREQAEITKAERTAIQTNYGEPKTASFMNDKGGVGKTTDTLCIADAFGRIRGGDVVTWDANETRGTMGFRAQKDNHRRNVVDFLNEVADAFTTVEGSKRSTLTRYTRQQGDSKFSVLASHESRESQDQVDHDAFRTVHEILSRFYSLILVDTGNNHTADHFQAALAATDQLVVPVSPGEDGAYAAELMLDNFIGQGYGHLVKNAIVLLHDSATRHGDAREIAAKFENRVRTILPIPFDPILDRGGEIDFDALQPTTRTAYQTAAAAIARGLTDTDRTAS